MNTNSFSLVHDIFDYAGSNGFKPANFFFFFLSLSFLYAQVLVNQFIFFPLFFPHFLYMHNQTWI